MHDLTELLRVLVWRATVLVILFVLRTELQRFTKNVADRIRTANSISIGLRGVELRGLIRVAPAPPDLQARKVRLNRFIRGMTSKAELDRIADDLDVPMSSNPSIEKDGIIIEINRRVAAEAEMSALSDLLRKTTGQDF